MIRLRSFGSDVGTLSLLLVLAGQLGCQQGATPPDRGLCSPSERPTETAFELKAKLFESRGDIPKEFTCDGPDASPELTWTQPPAATQSFALIMEDPAGRTGSSVHWVVYDVPPTARELPEAMTARDELVDGSRQGLNGFGKVGYSAPSPPPGTTVRYSFKLFALDTKLKLKARATKEDVERAMAGHVLGQAVLVGLYSRHQARPRK